MHNLKYFKWSINCQILEEYLKFKILKYLVPHPTQINKCRLVQDIVNS